MPLKHCTKCGLNFPVENFPRNSRTVDGLDVWCRECRSKSSREYYARNRQQVIARSRLWRQANPDRFRELQKQAARKRKIPAAEWERRKAATKERTRECVRRCNRERYDHDLEYRSRKRVYEYARRERLRAERKHAELENDLTFIRKYGVTRKRSHHKLCPLLKLFPSLLASAKAAAYLERQARRDPAKIRAAVRNWRRKHPGAVSRQRSRRRAYFSSTARNDLTTTQWLAIQAAYNHRCAYCGEKKPLTQDHVVPISKGGDHTASNIVPACLSCNASKGARLPTVSFQPHLIA